ncbi:MAG: hypothetical protein ACI9DK_002623 [Vicingaceae bacterium]
MLVSKAIGRTGTDRSRTIAIDRSGTIYVAGAFSNAVNFNRSTTGLFSKTSNGGLDAFIAKFDANGILVWVNTFGETSDDETLSVSTNAMNEVIITGFFRGTVDFGPSVKIQNVRSNNNSTDVFLTKLDSNGTLIWNKTFGFSSNLDGGREVSDDKNDNIVFTGTYGGTIDVDSSAAMFNLYKSYQKDSFISKFVNQGNLV